jgi:hypothetical protein
MDVPNEYIKNIMVLIQEINKGTQFVVDLREKQQIFWHQDK